MTDALPRDRHGARETEARAELVEIERHAGRIGVWRGLLFVTGALAVLLADRLPGATEAWWVGGGLALVAFGVLVRRHRRLRARAARVEAAADLARQGVARIDRRWAELPDPEPFGGDAGAPHPFARDLDLYGHASVRSLLGPVATPMGAERLDGWLLGDPPREEWIARQASVRVLAEAHALRERAAVEAVLLDRVGTDVLERFRRWLAEPADVRGSWLDAARWLLPALTVSGVALDLLGMAPSAPWALLLVAQAAVAFRAARRLHPGFARASSGAPGLRRYHRLVAVWQDGAAALDAPARDLAAAFVGDEGRRSASDALRALARLLDAADARLQGMLHPVLAVGVLWDLHVAAGLDRWREADGARVPGWMDALGELEALSALATLAADHPDWCWPEARAGEPPRLSATGLGHPLLPDDRCVRNDVELGPPGSVLLVTGSNMSGKSTLLRSIGTAVVLARAGAPVCARALRLPDVTLFTSMRLEDSLEAGVSFFMAELQRLSRILESAPPGGDTTHRPLLYLVDEMLHGTNSEERQAAGRRVIRHLLRRRAIGAVTTHDLDLHRDPEVEAAARLVHFQESVEAGPDGPALSFDYRLREGLATTRNALLLAERMGITDPGSG